MKCSSFLIILKDDLEILAIAPKTIKTIDHEERRSFAGLALWPGLKKIFYTKSIYMSM